MLPDLPGGDRTHPAVLHRPARPALRVGARRDPSGARHRARLAERRRRAFGDRARDPPRRAQRPGAAGHAFFYLRDPAWVDTLPPEERATFVEEGDDGRRRLAELRGPHRRPARSRPPYARRDRARRSGAGRPHRLVESLYPDPTPPDPLTRAASIQRTYGASRFTAFVERPEQAALLDRVRRRSGAAAAGDGSVRASVPRRSSRTGPPAGPIGHPDERSCRRAPRGGRQRRRRPPGDGPPARRRAGRAHARRRASSTSDTTDDAAALREHAPPGVHRDRTVAR